MGGLLAAQAPDLLAGMTAAPAAPAPLLSFGTAPQARAAQALSRLDMCERALLTPQADPGSRCRRGRSA